MPTNSRIDRAGVRLRKAETPSDTDRELFSEFRAEFAQPLAEVVEELRGLAGGAPVTSRLKRFETTIQKLRRHKTRLSSIEDIAGCRVILPTLREQRGLFMAVRREFDVVRERDYQVAPRHGYRAMHTVVRARGRLVEIQLRTELEEQWAHTVERLAERYDQSLKYGGGSPSLRDALELMSDIFSEFDTSKSIIARILAVLPVALDHLLLNPGVADRLSASLGPLRELLHQQGAALNGSAIGNLQRDIEYDLSVVDDPEVLEVLERYLESTSALTESLSNLHEALEQFTTEGDQP